MLARGAGTSIAGQATGIGVVLDFTRHMRTIVRLDPDARTAVVRPGVILDDLRGAAGAYGLTFGPDPSTHSRCTLGGMIGNNSCGAHSVAWGTTADNVHELEVLTYGGERVRLGAGRRRAFRQRLRAGVSSRVQGELALLRTGFPELPRRISGYALDALLPENGGGLGAGLHRQRGHPGRADRGHRHSWSRRRAPAPSPSSGTPTRARRPRRRPALLPHRPLDRRRHGRRPGGRAAAGPLPRGGAWLFVEAGGDDPAEAKAHAEQLCAGRAASGATDHAVVTDPAGQRALWRIREDASGTATRHADRRHARRGPAGRTAPCRPPGWAPTCASSARC